MQHHHHRATLVLLALLAASLVLGSCSHSPQECRHTTPQEYTDEEQRVRATVIEDCLSLVDGVEIDGYDPPVELVTDGLEVSGERVTQEAFDRFVRFYAPIDDGTVHQSYGGRFLVSLTLHHFWKKRLDEQEITVTRGEVDDTFAVIRSRFPNKRAFVGFLGAVSATPSSLRAAVCRDLRLSKYIAGRVDLRASDREVRAFFDAHRPSLAVSLRTDVLPEFEEVAASIREHLEATKLYAGYITVATEELDGRPMFVQLRVDGSPLLFGLSPIELKSARDAFRSRKHDKPGVVQRGGHRAIGLRKNSDVAWGRPAEQAVVRPRADDQ